MELEIQIEQVLECLPCNLANCTLSNVGKRGVQKLAKQSCADSCKTIFEAIRAQLVSSLGKNIEDADVQPTISDPPTTHTVDPAVGSTLNASMICLNRNGTCTFNS